ncbi:ferredoxin-type protein NapG [Aliamphritea hakodatensis]|uniref:ferredoxin-type protein NapG n=1 Tax=Aliamphritea hakodatensis TaxID=2895352 RepID=UPI0022FDA700|nr:ferredoxin-type protein NapG [Aliamphritea hakodatensis]
MKQTMDKQRRSESSASKAPARRQFFTDVARGASAAGMIGLGLTAWASSAKRSDPQAIRPPGALSGDDFLNACLRCGLCVEDCPYDTLKLATLFDPAPSGTPWFEARKVPCEMCEDIPCVAACPSGALDPALKNIDDARMGTAVLIDEKNCLNFQGLRCDVCYRVCPLIDEAITLERQRNSRTGKHALFIPTVQSDACTGCGKCEEACVLDETAIKVLPLELASGTLGQHYRLGWEEKARNGGSLVPEQLKLEIRRPENSNAN